MEFDNNIYRELFAKMPDAFAYHQVIYDRKGNPVDYLFLEINDAFEQLTGLKREAVIGKKVTEVHPEIGESAFDWIDVYGQVAKEAKSIRFEQYFEPAGRWYDVSAFSDAPGFFAVSFREVTTQKNENKAFAMLIDRAQEIMHFPAGELNYQVIADGLLELSEAKFAAVNLYDQDRQKSVTKALSGISKVVRKVSGLLGFELVGNEWDIMPERVNAIQEGHLLHFKNLHDSASGAISATTSSMLERLGGTGSVYVVEMRFEDDTLGDMIMFMPRHKTLVNPQIIEIYAALVASALVRFRADEELINLKTFNESIVQNINEGIVIYNNSGETTFTNPNMLQMVGYEADEFIGTHWTLLVPPQYHQLVEEANARRSAGESDRYELEVKHKNGSLIPVQTSGSPYHDSRTGEVVGTLALLTNLTDRVKAEEALKESEQRYREILETTAEGFYEVDLKGKIVACNRAAAKMLGFKQEELTGLNYKSLCKDFDAVFREFNQAFASGKSKFNVLLEMIRKDGSINIADLSVSLIYDQQGNITGFRGMGRDITERVKLEEHLKHISLHDELTGLYNRRYFENELARLDRSRDYPVAVISADLDGLKLINDTLGHSEGDRYLQAGAELLKNTLRSSDVLARVGGDEFAIILPRTDREAAEELVTRLRARIDQYNSQQHKIPISISIGLAVSAAKAGSLEETYKEADNAMYNDKLKRSLLARAGIVDSLVKTLSTKKNLGEGKSEQVEELSERFGRYLQLGEKEFANLLLLAKVYDLGKVNMPDQLVHSELKEKEGELTTAERETIRRHPEIGYRIATSSPELSEVADLILRHHESYDGSGYPLGLKGDDIALECRIMAIITAYSAMTNHRPYAKKLKAAEALEELKRCAGTQFDPRLVEEFLALLASESKS